jgi:hypothetical protein
MSTDKMLDLKNNQKNERMVLNTVEWSENKHEWSETPFEWSKTKREWSKTKHD